MRATIGLGRWLGVPVGLHYSWFVIAWLMTLSLANQFAAQNPEWSPRTVWALSVATAGLFFICIVLHELAHAVVARLAGVPVRGITLFALGGIALIEKQAATPSKEFWMAIAGPIASVLIGVGCRVAAYAQGWSDQISAPSPAAALFGWLGYINIVLASFNLIPGFPLDGGRVLRSIVWAITADADRATRISARVGQAIAFVFIALGLFALLVQNDFGGLWIAFIGWFLLETAQAYYAETDIAARLRSVRVSDVMARDCITIRADMTLQNFVSEYLLRLVGRCFAVSRDDRVVGLITPQEVKHIDRDQWPRTTVSDAMRPIESVHTVRPDAPASDVLTLMARENVNQVPVVANGHLEGVVTRSYLVQLLQLRSELHA